MAAKWKWSKENEIQTSTSHLHLIQVRYFLDLFLYSPSSISLLYLTLLPSSRFPFPSSASQHCLPCSRLLNSIPLPLNTVPLWFCLSRKLRLLLNRLNKQFESLIGFWGIRQSVLGYPREHPLWRHRKPIRRRRRTLRRKLITTARYKSLTSAVTCTQ